LLLLALGACSPAAPAIEQVSPNKGEGSVAGDAQIKVTFDRAMDRQSVVSRFEVSPAVDGCDRGSCPITWDKHTMIFSHTVNEFRPDTKYAVRIKPGYRDAAGRVNNIEHSWEFHTDTAPMLQSSNPGSDAKGVAPDVDITLQFSRSMQLPSQQQLKLIDSQSDIAAGVPCRVTLDPGDSSRVVVSPLRLLASRHRYRLLITSDFQDARHTDTGRAINLSFSTGDADLTRSIAFTVLDAIGAPGHRIAVLRPPASLGAPAPSLRVVYRSTDPIGDFGWAANARHLYTLESSPTEIVRVDVANGSAQKLGIMATAMAMSPATDEIAYVAPDRGLHLWSPPLVSGAPAVDIPVPDAGLQVGAPSWSGDGRRLAMTIDSTAGPALAVLERSTLSRFVVPSVRVVTAVAGGGPRWSIDGNAVAFERAVAGGSEVWTFRPLAAPGSDLSRIGKIADAALAWSSDGATIYAAGDFEGRGARLLTRAPALPVDGQTAAFTRLLSTVAGDNMPATPSFDRRLAFIRAPAGVPQLWLVNGDGSGLSQLTFERYSAVERLTATGVDLPRWAPGAGGS
jgi:Tol biopolymer transport system component